MSGRLLTGVQFARFVLDAVPVQHVAVHHWLSAVFEPVAAAKGNDGRGRFLGVAFQRAGSVPSTCRERRSPAVEGQNLAGSRSVVGAAAVNGVDVLSRRAEL